jgi:hypothetical protein
LLVCKVSVGSFGADAQPASNKEANAMTGTNKRRIGLILKIKGSVHPATEQPQGRRHCHRVNVSSPEFLERRVRWTRFSDYFRQIRTCVS